MKLEDLINNLIIRLGELAMKLFRKLTPTKVMAFYNSCISAVSYVIKNFKSLPVKGKVWAIDFLKRIKAKLLAIDYKGKILESYQAGQTFYKAQSAKGAGKFKALVITPVMLVASWLKGLTPLQSVMLITFTAASFLSGVTIVSEGRRIMAHNKSINRAPASEEDLFKYDRPDYYKKDQRHVLLSNIRLPVYVAKVNELRSVDIDFTATVTNRHARIFLEKYEFQLRDFLILHIEPLIASFPLEEEGREVLRKKIWLEIDNFLKERNVEGHVLEVKITYILAN